jgi:polyphenol oxidase
VRWTPRTPADPRGFTQQAHIHCFICSQSPTLQVHGTQNFLPWHRAYLYFHERILGKLIGDLNFRLPYWDWENPSHRTLPGPYTNPNNNTNPLFNGTRSMSPTDTLPAFDVDLGPALSSGTFSLFSSTLENGPHGSVHVDVGGNMGAFSTAAQDPVFYAHHSNVDKAWADWVKADPSHTNPATATWLNKSYGFFDENKVWRSITNTRLADHEGNLRYYYGTRAFEYISLLCIRRWRDLVLTLNPAAAAFTHSAATLTALRGAAEKGAVHMVITDPQLPRDISAIYSVYISEREAAEDRGADSPGYIGQLSYVQGSKEHQHELPAGAIALDVSRRVKTLIERTGENVLCAVQRTPKPAQKRVLKVPFKSVSYRVGDVG